MLSAPPARGIWRRWSAGSRTRRAGRRRCVSGGYGAAGHYGGPDPAVAGGIAAELLRVAPPPSEKRLVDARAVAEALGVTRGFVYGHAHELGPCDSAPARSRGCASISKP